MDANSDRTANTAQGVRCEQVKGIVSQHSRLLSSVPDFPGDAVAWRLNCKPFACVGLTRSRSSSFRSLVKGLPFRAGYVKRRWSEGAACQPSSLGVLLLEFAGCSCELAQETDQAIKLHCRRISDDVGHDADQPASGDPAGARPHHRLRAAPA